MNLTNEMHNIAKSAKTAEELIALAKEHNVDATEEAISAYFEEINKTGELADDELDSVAGGWCYNKGRPVITIGEQHDCFVCKYCNEDTSVKWMGSNAHACGSKENNSNAAEWVINNCNNCKWCIYEKGLWLCNNPDNRE